MRELLMNVLLVELVPWMMLKKDHQSILRLDSSKKAIFQHLGQE